MCELNAEVLRTARRLKLIIQYGVGVEGIDIAQVSIVLQSLNKYLQSTVALGNRCKYQQSRRCVDRPPNKAYG